MKDCKTRIGLGTRQLQIVQHLVTGATDQQIADALGVSRRTVSHALASAYDKTGVSSRTHLVVLYLQGCLFEDVRPRKARDRSAAE